MKHRNLIHNTRYFILAGSKICKGRVVWFEPSKVKVNLICIYLLCYIFSIVIFSNLKKKENDKV